MNQQARAAAVAAALFLGPILILGGCAEIPLLASRTEQADSLAASHGWQRLSIPAGRFELAAYRPKADGADPGRPLRVYIEGDGVSWVTRTQLSSDPTPDDRLTLSLALQDPDGGAVYLARPCQYLDRGGLARCHPGYWSTARYAPEVIASTNAAIDWLKRRAAAPSVELFGYSGGGAVAVLAAAARDDVDWIVTVAANLDHVLWTREAGDTPLVHSLNPADEAARLAHVPQVHFIGLQDEKIPAEVIESYVARTPPGAPIRLVRVPDYGHACCWKEAWPALLERHRPLLFGAHGHVPAKKPATASRRR